MRRCDYYEAGDHWCLRFHEKGGKVRAIPVRFDLQHALDAYLLAGGLEHAEPRWPLFRTTVRRTRRLTLRPLRQAGLTCIWSVICEKAVAAIDTALRQACFAEALMFALPQAREYGFLLPPEDDESVLPDFSG